MKKGIILIGTYLLTIFPSQACDLKKYESACVGKTVIHKKVGTNSKIHHREGTILRVTRKKKNKWYRIKFKGLKKVHSEYAHHLFLQQKSMKNFKSILIAGDHSINNFDQARMDFSDLIAYFGAAKKDQIHLSARKQYFKKPLVAKSTLKNVKFSFKKLKKSRKNGCLVFMTSHGSKKEGFYLSRDKSLTPEILAKHLDKACGKKPTVLIVSGCYSGQYINSKLKRNNRIILTSSRSDRMSFGCSTHTDHTYYDNCLLKLMPNSVTWKDVYENVKICISKREKEEGLKPASLPQAYFGANMRNLELYKN